MEQLQFNPAADTLPKALNITEERAIEISDAMDALYDMYGNSEAIYFAGVLSLAKTPAEAFLIGVCAGKASMMGNDDKELIVMSNELVVAL